MEAVAETVSRKSGFANLSIVPNWLQDNEQEQEWEKKESEEDASIRIGQLKESADPWLYRVLELRYLKGLTLTQVGQRLGGLTKERARQLCLKARVHARQKLEEVV